MTTDPLSEVIALYREREDFTIKAEALNAQNKHLNSLLGDIQEKCRIAETEAVAARALIADLWADYAEDEREWQRKTATLAAKVKLTEQERNEACHLLSEASDTQEALNKRIKKLLKNLGR